MHEQFFQGEILSFWSLGWRLDAMASRKTYLMIHLNMDWTLTFEDMLFQSTYRLQAFPLHSRAFQVLDSPDLTGQGETLHIGGQVVALLPQILLQPDQNNRCLWAVSPHLRIPLVPNIVIATWIIFSSICAAS